MTKIQFPEACQNGECRETVWKATAVLAVTGEMVGYRLPNWPRPGNRLERHCHFGDDRGNIWEGTAEMAVAGKVIGNGPPKRRCPEKRLGSNCRMGRWRGSSWKAALKPISRLLQTLRISACSAVAQASPQRPPSSAEIWHWAPIERCIWHPWKTRDGASKGLSALTSVLLRVLCG